MPTAIRTAASRLTLAALLAVATALVSSVNAAHAASAHLVKDIRPGGDGSAPADLEGVRGTLYFNAFTPTFREGLWRSDGTAAGTGLLSDAFAYAYWLTGAGETLFFLAHDEHGTELWRSDGTKNGTTIVRDIRVGHRSSSPSGLTNNNGVLYFTARDGVHGAELWRSDGTGAGTKFLKRIVLRPHQGVNIGGTGFFAANDHDRFGWELWATDGTRSGTKLVRDINPGRENARPGSLAAVGGTLFFSATDDVHGAELWKAIP